MSYFLWVVFYSFLIFKLFRIQKIPDDSIDVLRLFKWHRILKNNQIVQDQVSTQSDFQKK